MTPTVLFQTPTITMSSISLVTAKSMMTVIFWMMLQTLIWITMPSLVGTSPPTQFQKMTRLMALGELAAPNLGSVKLPGELVERALANLNPATKPQDPERKPPTALTADLPGKAQKPKNPCPG